MWWKVNIVLILLWALLLVSGLATQPWIHLIVAIPVVLIVLEAFGIINLNTT